MADMLNIALSGLMASRAAMTTTGHNIANVNTPYYSKQRVNLDSTTAELQSYGYIGRGVDIESVTRAYDGFVMQQLRGYNSTVSRYDTLNTLAGQVSSALGDNTIGLTPDLEAFFGALHDVADSPNSLTSRQTLLDEAANLVTRIQDTDNTLSTLRDSVNTGISNAVSAINELSSGIANINKYIAEASISPTNQPNDLLDQRDKMLVDLSKLSGVQAVIENDGTMNVFLGNGQALVVGNTAYQLAAVRSGFDPQETTVRLESQADGADLESYITDGELGGYFEFRRTVLHPAQDGLGLLATGLTTTMNEQHQHGMDLNGDLGGDLFKVGSPKVLAHGINTGDATFTAAVTTDSTLPVTDAKAAVAATRLLRSDYEIRSIVGSHGLSTNSATTATVLLPTVTDPYNSSLMNTVQIQFSDATHYNVVDVTAGNTLLGTGVLTNGSSISYNGWTVQIKNDAVPSTAISAGDTFEISPGFSAVRLLDNETILSNGDLAALNTELNKDGLNIALSTGSAKYGDRFLLQPTRYSSAGFGLTITDPRKIAAASPIITSANSANLGSASISAGTVTDAANTSLQNNIRIQFTSASTFDVLDLTTGTTLASNVSYTSGDPISYNGWSININGSPQGRVGLNPITANANSSNTGTATIATPTVNNIYNTNLLNSVSIKFTDDTHYSVFDTTTGQTLSSNNIYVSGGNIVSSNGWTAQISGTPKSGDTFQIKPDGDSFQVKNNVGGIGDNRNALELVKLQTKQQLLGGNDYRGIYATMIAEVGAKGRNIETTLQSQKALFAQSELSRESISGVNLDEEAADLMRFQQAYQAAAQLIQVSNSLFDALISAARS